MSDAFKFVRSEGRGPLLELHMARASLPDGSMVTVILNKQGGAVGLSMHTSLASASMQFTADQARSVAAELLAAADISDTGEAGRKGRH